MEDYKLTVGLEIHLELKTKTKMFCACKNDPDEVRPNVNICPVCLGHPGILPVINKEAVKHIRKVGLALGGKLAQQSVFDRKNYFYPDIPKGYQISQYKHPLVSGGNLSGAVITRVHLEEDTAKSSHSKDASLVDFNRSGVPLMELVTEPCIKSASEAAKFAKELQLLVQYLEISEANMEKGEMRIEANISVSKNASLGTKVEVKNLNSFKVVEKAIDYEYKRQSALLEGGEKVVQETRGWDEASQSTFSQRSKEDSHDYRYFNDPDLPSLDLALSDEMHHESLQKELKETPDLKRLRYGEFGLKKEDIEFYINNRELASLFEEVANKIKVQDTQLLSNYIISDLAGMGDQSLDIDPSHLAELISMISGDRLSSRGGKDILQKMLLEKDSPETLAVKYDLVQKNDEALLEATVESVLLAHPQAVSEYKSGKISSIQFLVGQCMKELKGSGNPVLLKSLLEKSLNI